MTKFFKMISTAIATMALSVTVATADTAQKPEQLEFSSVSTQSSAPFWFPAFIAFSLATTLDDDTRVQGGSGKERVLSSDDLDALRVELGWALGGSSAASSFRGGSAGSLVPYAVLGAVLVSNNINSFTDANGNSFPTDGKSKFRGIYGGLNFNLLGRASASAASSSAAVLVWDAFFNVGWGRAEVDAFNGSFTRNETGAFYEVGTSLQTDFGGVLFGPELTYRMFDQSVIERDEWTAGLKFTFPLDK